MSWRVAVAAALIHRGDKRREVIGGRELSGYWPAALVSDARTGHAPLSSKASLGGAATDGGVQPQDCDKEVEEGKGGRDPSD
jgi:hypothetical protein